jgi:hypothetical protein
MVMQEIFKWALSKPPDGKEIDVPFPGVFRTHMERAFGMDFPFELTQKDIPTLNGMAACWPHKSVNPYVMLIEAVGRYKAIKVWSEHEELRKETNGKEENNSD